MPKMKSRRAAVKRFALTKSGKVRRRKAFASHILTSKSRKRKRGLRQATLAHETDVKRVKQMLAC